MSVRLAKTQISLGIRPVWSESSLCAQCVAKDPSFLHAKTDQTGRMPRLTWVFAGRTTILLVLSCRGSYDSVCLTKRSGHQSVWSSRLIRFIDARLGLKLNANCWVVRSVRNHLSRKKYKRLYQFYLTEQLALVYLIVLTCQHIIRRGTHKMVI